MKNRASLSTERRRPPRDGGDPVHVKARRPLGEPFPVERQAAAGPPGAPPPGGPPGVRRVVRRVVRARRGFKPQEVSINCRPPNS